MKAFVFSLFLFGFIATSHAAHQHHSDHPSTHGMLILGQKKIYLSHLPMFHTPHDYQVIFEAEFSPKGKEAYLTNSENSDETVYTLVPETFVLPEMVQNPKPFSAQIFKGHFERGGVLIANDVTVVITKIIYFKKFSSTEAKPAVASYILFGNEVEQFLAHSITTKPDFDQILKVTVSPEILKSLTQKDVLPISFAKMSNTKPLQEGVELGSEIKAERFLYLETGDLSF